MRFYERAKESLQTFFERFPRLARGARELYGLFIRRSSAVRELNQRISDLEAAVEEAWQEGYDKAIAEERGRLHREHMQEIARYAELLHVANDGIEQEKISRAAQRADFESREAQYRQQIVDLFLGSGLAPAFKFIHSMHPSAARAKGVLFGASGNVLYASVGFLSIPGLNEQELYSVGLPALRKHLAEGDNSRKPSQINLFLGGDNYQLQILPHQFLSREGLPLGVYVEFDERTFDRITREVRRRGVDILKIFGYSSRGTVPDIH